MTLPSVAIGIATYNRPEETVRAVASVLNQDYRGHITCAVYDDGSDEVAFDALRTYQWDQWPNRLMEYHQGADNRGIAYAKNRALMLGSGDLRGILDSDDYYHPTFVSRCVAELQAHPEVVAVYTDNLRVLPDGTTLTEPAADWSIEALLRCQLRGDCYLARWDVLDRTGLHDERFELEVDYDLYYALAEQGPLRRIPEALMTVTEHAGRTTRNRDRAAHWHAAGLGKWGHGIEWATQRAARNPEWLPAIKAGYVFGKGLRDAPR